MSTRKNTLTTILILLLLILGAGLGYTIFELKKLKGDYVTLLNKNNTVEDLYSELEDEYDRSLSQLDELEGENASLDSMVVAKKAELKEAKSYIASLISNKNATAAELADAKNLITQLSNQRISLQNAVDSLREKNLILEEDKIALIQEKEIIKTTLDEVSEQASRMEIENEDLKDNINLASILTADGMVAKGIKIKSNGKEVEVSKANSTKKLKLCFKLLENKIAKEGPTKIQIRIIGPDGVTLALKSLGSGTFADAMSGQSIQYTYEIAPDFNKWTKSVCSYWDQNVAYTSGKYKVEVYQMGYKIGNTSFDLR